MRADLKSIQTLIVSYFSTHMLSRVSIRSALPLLSLLVLGLVMLAVPQSTGQAYTTGDADALRQGSDDSASLRVAVDDDTGATTPIGFSPKVTLSNSTSTDIDLAISIASINTTTPSEGESVQITVRVDNNTGHPIDNISFTDVLPAGLTFSSFSNAHGSCTQSSTARIP